MKRVFRWLVFVPVAVILVAFSIANRAWVTVSLDPFRPDNPVLSFTAPLFWVLFVVLAIGILVGGAAAWLRQGKWRRAAREAERLRRDAMARRASQPIATLPEHRSAA